MVRAFFVPAMFLCGVVALLGACGAVISTPTIRDAELAVQAAEMEQAEQFATYEFVSAVQYLEKAKEEWGFSDFQHAEEYGQRARELAEAALERAVANPNRNAPGLGLDDEGLVE